MNFHGIFALSPSLAALSLVPEQAELSPWLSPVLVLPVLQLLSCSSLTEALADQRTHSHNRDLAHSLLRRISREMDKPRQVSQRLLLRSLLSKTFFKRLDLAQMWNCCFEISSVSVVDLFIYLHVKT